MNKFIILLAFVSVAAAVPVDIETDSQSFLHPNNDEEAASLPENKKIFTDFCLSSRDYLYGDIKANTNGFAGSVFRLVFNSVENVGTRAIETQREAVDRLSNQMVNPNAQIAEATNTVEQIIAEGQEKIKQEQSQPRTMIQAFLSTVSATGTVVKQGIIDGFEAVSKRLGVDGAIKLLEDACNKVAMYEQSMRDQFESYKQEVAAHDPSVAALSIEKVPCVTSIRIIRADGACKLAKAAQSPFTKILTTARRN